MEAIPAWLRETYIEVTCDREFACITDPKFVVPMSRIRQWRRSIPPCLEDNWNNLSAEARAVAVLMAEIHASNEDW